MTYQLYNRGFNGSTILRSDGAFIPQDPMNMDYQTYLAWVALANVAVPLPAAAGAP